ncbi:hypothetical protein SAMN03159341_106234 [Paenibacillus sp. 1_12]|uniref:hypothetical protein n=1 Tax=Paenibacillus sp. 1_12 TaxID=1566278 RepID=UPI0008ED476D|nr:hypothetical protein [Paenibacillus sp. 1_12]SFL47360.1 hypothetical protein SAMN03159341_106234 [Paenibacillus sp. 1_12]
MTFDRLTSISLCIVVLFVIVGIILMVVKRHRNNQNPFSSSAKASSRKHHRKDSTEKSLTSQYQSCSYCKRKVNPKELSFYSGHEKVVGVCKTCKPHAERQSLLRL